MNPWKIKFFVKRVERWLLSGCQAPPPNFPCVFIPIEEKKK